MRKKWQWVFKNYKIFKFSISFWIEKKCFKIKMLQSQTLFDSSDTEKNAAFVSLIELKMTRFDQFFLSDSILHIFQSLERVRQLLRWGDSLWMFAESLRWINRIQVFNRVSWILQLGVWESAGLWVESDAPKLSSVSVPGSVTSAPWEREVERKLIMK